MTNKQDLFNPVFRDLKKRIKDQKDAIKRDEIKESQIAETVTPNDENFFDEAMYGVTPMPRAGRERVSSHTKQIRPSHLVPDVEKEAMTHLRDLVKGSIDMDITFSDEYIEGSVSGIRKNIIRQLKRGQLPVQDYIDLHGLTKKEAETKVRDFLLNSYSRGFRCVLIVHGRGLNSPDSIPVLKERLPVWLNRGPARKIVLAFATARPYDGGTGAIYVLLRNRS